MGEVTNFVTRRTVISAGFRAHAAYQAMEVHLRDWRDARDRLNRQIALLETLSAVRQAEADAGLWPPKRNEGG